MRRNYCQWLVAGGLSLMPQLARAEDEPKPYAECTKQPTDNEVGAAKGAFQAGSASFDEADYPRAITYWEDAYRRDCTANGLLKNLARAYELNGQKRHAVVALETFLLREPNTGEKESIQRRIEAMKRQIEAEKAAPVAAPVTPAAQAQPQTGAPPANGDTMPPPATVQGKRPIAPLIVAGAGGVVFLVGLAGYSKAAQDVKDNEKLCPNRKCEGGTAAENAANIQKGNDARSRQVTYGVVTWVGLAAGAGGLVWYFLSPRKQPSTALTTPSRPVLAPAAAPGYAGVSLSGNF